MESEQIINEANAYLDDMERKFNFIYSWLPWAFIIIGFVFIGIFSYQYVHYGEKIREANESLNQKINQYSGNEQLSKIIDAKISLARLKASQEKSGFTSAVTLILAGVVLLILRKSRQRYFKVMRGLIQLVQKNS